MTDTIFTHGIQQLLLTIKGGILMFIIDFRNQKLCVLKHVVDVFRHEVADVAGLASFSFGHEEEDRYVMLWKKVHNKVNKAHTLGMLICALCGMTADT